MLPKRTKNPHFFQTLSCSDQVVLVGGSGVINYWIAALIFSLSTYLTTLDLNCCRQVQVKQQNLSWIVFEPVCIYQKHYSLYYHVELCFFLLELFNIMEEGQNPSPWCSQTQNSRNLYILHSPLCHLSIPGFCARFLIVFRNDTNLILRTLFSQEVCGLTWTLIKRIN